jgi:hypothetical protein
MKKGVSFKWEEQHTRALNELIHKVTTASMLVCLDPKQQFHIKVNASSFALGAVLFQKNKLKKR